MSLYRQAGSVANGGATTIVATWASATVAGNCGVASIWVNGGTAIDVTPPSGWSLATAEVDKSTGLMLATYTYPNMPARTAGQTETFTIVLSGTSTPDSHEAGLVWAEYAGIATVSVIDKQNQATGSSTGTDSGATGTLSSGNEIFIAAVAHKSAPPTFDLDTASATGGFTLIAKVGSSTSGTLKINGALFEKDAAGSTASGDLTVPITGGTQAWCGKIISLNKAGGAPPATGTDDGKVYRSSEGHYYSFTLPDLATAQAWALKNELITTQPNKLGGFADQMVVSKPAIVLAPYDKTVQINPGQYGITTFPESWFAHSGTPATSSNRVSPGGFPNVYIMQPDSTANWTDTTGAIGTAGAVYAGWNPFARQLIKNDIQVANDAYALSDPYTGWFGDSAGSFSLVNQVVPGTNTQYTLAAWLLLVNATLDAINAFLPGKSGWANGIDSNLDLPNHVSAGGMNENWLWSSGGAASEWPSDSKFVSGCQVGLDAQLVTSKAMRGVVHAWGLTLAADIEKRRRGVVCAYMLTNRGKLLVEYSVTQSSAPWLVDQGPAFTIDLHAPRDSQSQITAYRVKQGAGGGWLYQRRYNRGCILFNTDANPVVWTLDRSDYKELDGVTAAPQTYTVPAKTGVILTATADPAGAPVNTVAPGVPTGTQTQGLTLTAVNGTWTGSPTFSYQWQRDNAGGGVFADIPGATSPTYVLMAADVGNKIRVKVTGTNAGGSVTANSTATGLIAAGAAAPGNTTLPILSPTTPSAGQTVTTTDGTWTGSPTSFAYQWQHLDPNTLAATNVGLNQNSYDVVDTDAGFLIRCTVTATNASGSTPINSAPTDVVAPRPPAVPTNTVQPAAPTGSTTQGGTLTAQNGTWTGSPTFTYQWQQFNGTTATNIAGATGATYTTQTADIGVEIQVIVTGTNAGGSANATSLPTAAIAPQTVTPPPPPVVTAQTPTWRFVICARDGTPIKVLEQTTARQLSQQFLAASALTLTCPLSEIPDGVLEEGYHRLKAYRQNTLAFHGRIWQADETASDQEERVTLTAYDPLYTMGLAPWAPAVIRQAAISQSFAPDVFTNATLFQIMLAITQSLSGQAGSQSVFGSHPGELQLGNQNGTPPRTNCVFQPSDILLDNANAYLLQVDDGIELICRPIEGTTGQYLTNGFFSGATTPHWAIIEQVSALDVYYPTAGATQPFTLSYGTAAHNLVNVARHRGADEVANWALAQGAGDGGQPYAQEANDETSIARLGVLYKNDQLPNIATQAALHAHARRLLQPTVPGALSVTPIPGTIRLFDDFQVADTISVAINKGRIQEYGQRRVLAATLQLSDTDGSEIVSQLVLGPPVSSKPVRTKDKFLGDTLANHRRRIKQIETGQPVTTRHRDPATGQIRQISGLQDDGTYGLRIWNASGSLVYDHTA